MNRPSPIRVTVAALVVMGAALDFAGPATLAGGPNHKTFEESVSDGTTSSTTSLPINAGNFTLHFTIANTSSGRSAVPYGSFQLKVPAGITNVAASNASGTPSNFNSPIVDTSVTPNTVTITSNGPTGSGIAPGSSMTVDVTGTASTGVCPGTWPTQVKQSNDFSGTGNDFVGNSVSTPVAGGDKLVWSVQPSDTEYDLDMSPSPQVQLQDACGNVITGFTGDISVTDTAGKMTSSPRVVAAVNGTATYAGVRFSDWGFSDTLTATAGSLTKESNAFNVYQWRQPCGTNGCKTGSLSGPAGQTLANIQGNPASTSDTLTVNVKGLANEATDSPCYTTSQSSPPLGELVTFDLANHSKTVTLTLPKTYVNEIPNNGTPFMDICLDVGIGGLAFFDKQHYANPTAFPDKVTAGLLPDCSVTGTDGGPCITTRKKNAGNEIIVFTAPAGDPHAMWR